VPDQAAGLRSLFARRRPSLLIVAGSDPAKAAVALHFACEAAAGCRATLVIDGTPGQVAMACNVPGRYELAHVIAGDVPFRDVVRSLTPYLLLLPAARALSRFGTFDAAEQALLVESFSSGISEALTDVGPQTQVDLIVVNADEGQASRAVDAFGRDARVVIVASDEGASLRGAYAEMKALSQRQGLENFEIVTPRAGDDAPIGVAFANLAATARRFLDIELVDGGAITLSPMNDLAALSSAGATRSADAASPDAERPKSPHSTSEEEVSHAAIA
jgi:MinD-like ATPase involved in chromosome partitioning or flagellar assembly